MDKISGISVFVQVADSGSYVAAGRVLGQTPSSVGKTIVKLEDELGVRLFHRNTRSISLTTNGSRFLERCRTILRDIAAAEEDIGRSHEIGKLKVSLPLVNNAWNRMLLEFMSVHPEIKLDLNYTNRKVDLIEEGFDIVLRIGPQEDSSLRSQRIGAFRLVLVASPAYLARRGMPKTLDDLSQHDCLRGRNASTCKLYDWPLGPEHARRSRQLVNRFVADHNAMLMSAALLGRGIACLPEFWAVDQVAAGELSLLLEKETTNSRDVSAIWPGCTNAPAKLKTFVDFIAEKLPAVLDGRAKQSTVRTAECAELPDNQPLIRSAED